MDNRTLSIVEQLKTPVRGEGFDMLDDTVDVILKVHAIPWVLIVVIELCPNIF